MRQKENNQSSFGSHQGTFWGDTPIIEKLNEQKTVSQVLITSLNKPKTPNKGKGKPGVKGTGKKSLARGSSDPSFLIVLETTV